MAGRRTRAEIVTTEAIAAAALEAGVDIESDLDAYLAEDALTEAMALYYDHRAEELRREVDVGAAGGVVRFLRRLLGVREARVSHEGRPETENTRSRPRAPAMGEGVSNEAGAPASIAPEPTALVVEPLAERAGMSPDDERSGINLASAATPAVDTFGKSWDEFVETKIEIRKDWRPSRRPELLSTRRLWIWIVGDLPIDACGSDQVRKFQDNYLLLPEDYVELRKGKNGVISPSEVIVAAKARAETQAKQRRFSAEQIPTRPRENLQQTPEQPQGVFRLASRREIEGRRRSRSDARVPHRGRQIDPRP